VSVIKVDAKPDSFVVEKSVKIENGSNNENEKGGENENRRGVIRVIRIFHPRLRRVKTVLVLDWMKNLNIRP
jgi:hypothetical protein